MRRPDEITVTGHPDAIRAAMGAGGAQMARKPGADGAQGSPDFTLALVLRLGHEKELKALRAMPETGTPYLTPTEICEQADAGRPNSLNWKLLMAIGAIEGRQPPNKGKSQMKEYRITETGISIRSQDTSAWEPSFAEKLL